MMFHGTLGRHIYKYEPTLYSLDSQDQPENDWSKLCFSVHANVISHKEELVLELFSFMPPASTVTVCQN